MIDLKDLRANPDKYRRGAELKRIPVDIDNVAALDRRRVSAQQTFDAMRADQNEASKSIGKLKGDEKAAAIARMGELKEKVKDAEGTLRDLEKQLEASLLTIPQPADDDVPQGRDASENVVVRTHGTPRAFDFSPKTHIELVESLGIVDFKAGVELAGSRSYILLGAGSELHQAVLRFAVDMMTREHGFTAMTVPVLVRESAMVGTGFFPAGLEQTYAVAEDEMYLTGTAEVGLTAYHAGQTLAAADLPRTYTAVSTCFRREAGTYGKDTAGLYRVHQFDKVEQVVLCKADEQVSREWHMKMLGYSEQLLQSLELPYRVIQCCTGDLGPKNAAMFDVETWMPSRFDGKDDATGYGETHSASRLYDYQARRLNLRYRDTDGQVKFCHTLNNTVVASPRILIPLLENHQQADGSVTIPAALRPYMGGRTKIG